ncbi:MAG: hypothetical protein AAFZ52_11320 [Bacteroidota bacterium]
MHTGVIVFYLPAKGYGYLRLEGTREEFHFRAKHLHCRVQAGDLVRFRLRQGRQGHFADEIVLAGLT